MTTEAERLANLEARVLKLENKSSARIYLEQKILDAALQAARLKSLGYEIQEDGRRITYNRDHAERMAEFYLLEIEKFGKEILRLETSS